VDAGVEVEAGGAHAELLGVLAPVLGRGSTLGICGAGWS
jgi:hypothetical protein